MRPRRSVWSVPQRLGTFITQRLWTFIMQAVRAERARLRPVHAGATGGCPPGPAGPRLSPSFPSRRLRPARLAETSTPCLYLIRRAFPAPPPGSEGQGRGGLVRPPQRLRVQPEASTCTPQTALKPQSPTSMPWTAGNPGAGGPTISTVTNYKEKI